GVTDEEGRVQICASTKWNALPNLHGVFVSILSHETRHVLLRMGHARASDDLDKIGSLSASAKSLKDIPKCSDYPHGLIGIWLQQSKIGKGPQGRTLPTRDRR